MEFVEFPVNKSCMLYCSSNRGQFSEGDGGYLYTFDASDDIDRKTNEVAEVIMGACREPYNC
jgi:hypothetical protein